MERKTFFILAMVLGMALGATAVEQGGIHFGFWYRAPGSVVDSDLKGVGIGLPIYAGKKVDGAALSIIANSNETVNGFQGSWLAYNIADTMAGCQLAFVNLIQKIAEGPTFQIGFYNQCETRGIQIGLVNNGRDNAIFQWGLVNINRHGAMPFMILFNFGKKVQ
ncbi:MAG: hypothetical protein BWY31_03355 [Lentisphaerae bacterium ADurb.Bin242]|nr:MAG: hypothetical protein BWY31_03355 [Lentisphaerae bacterium ADurb.Bin242]